MCEFCENDKTIISSIKQFADRIETVICGVKGRELFCSTMIQTSGIILSPAIAERKINYCPMCGRKLSEVSENDCE